jgi:hypothetical protein
MSRQCRRVRTTRCSSTLPLCSTRSTNGKEHALQGLSMELIVSNANCWLHRVQSCHASFALLKQRRNIDDQLMAIRTSWPLKLCECCWQDLWRIPFHLLAWPAEQDITKILWHTGHRCFVCIGAAMLSPSFVRLASQSELTISCSSRLRTEQCLMLARTNLR